MKVVRIGKRSLESNTVRQHNHSATKICVIHVKVIVRSVDTFYAKESQ